MDGIFAGTPPLEALRVLIHQAAAIQEGRRTSDKDVMVSGAARAFLEAPAVRRVRVGLPDEDVTRDDVLKYNVGHLKMSLYGTRGAAMNWPEEVANVRE